MPNSREMSTAAQRKPTGPSTLANNKQSTSGGGGGATTASAASVAAAPLLPASPAPDKELQSSSTPALAGVENNPEITAVAELMRQGKMADASALLQRLSTQYTPSEYGTFTFSNGDVYTGHFKYERAVHQPPPSTTAPVIDLMHQQERTTGRLWRASVFQRRCVCWRVLSRKGTAAAMGLVRRARQCRR